MTCGARLAGSEQAPLVRNELAVEFIPEERVDHYGNTAVSFDVGMCQSGLPREAARSENPKQSFRRCDRDRTVCDQTDARTIA